MSAVLWASPYVPPTPPTWQNPFPGLSMTWTGADGVVWDLKDKKSGVLLLADGVEGMHLPQFEDYNQEFAGLDGQEYRGGVAKARTVEWLVHVWSDKDSAEWLAREQAWWKSFKPRGSVGVWTVTDESGRSRKLRARLTSDGGFSHAFDPAAKGWHTYPVTLVADDPWWYGDDIVRGWEAPVERMFFGGESAGSDMQFPPLYISNANTFSTATFTNDGDEPTWPKWTVKGPVDSLTISVDGGTITAPPVAAGHTLVINTNPDDPVAFDGATEKTGLIDPWEPRPFPPGRMVPVTIAIAYSEGASISVEAPTKYWRAFG